MLRKRRNADGGFDFGPLGELSGAEEIFGLILIVVAAVVVLVLLFTLAIPLLVLGLELILVLVLAIAGVSGRLLFRRPWKVRARSSDGRELSWRAVGLRRSGRVRDAAAEAIARGERDPWPAEALPPR